MLTIVEQNATKEKKGKEKKTKENRMWSKIKIVERDYLITDKTTGEETRKTGFIVVMFGGYFYDKCIMKGHYNTKGNVTQTRKDLIRDLIGMKWLNVQSRNDLIIHQLDPVTVLK